MPHRPSRRVRKGNSEVSRRKFLALTKRRHRNARLVRQMPIQVLVPLLGINVIVIQPSQWKRN